MVDYQKPSKTVVTMVDHGHHFAWEVLPWPSDGQNASEIFLRGLDPGQTPSMMSLLANTNPIADQDVNKSDKEMLRKYSTKSSNSRLGFIESLPCEITADATSLTPPSINCTRKGCEYYNPKGPGIT